MAELGLREWAERLQDAGAEGLVDPGAGREVCWVAEEGWREGGE